MKQVSHASVIVPRMKDDPDEKLAEMLAAQFSHSDGIRGFFVTYLTGEGEETPADNERVPESLRYAMQEANQKDLVPLACKCELLKCFYMQVWFLWLFISSWSCVFSQV